MKPDALIADCVMKQQEQGTADAAVVLILKRKLEPETSLVRFTKDSGPYGRVLGPRANGVAVEFKANELIAWVKWVIEVGHGKIPPTPQPVQ